VLDRLGELMEQVRGAGLPVELVVLGSPRPLTDEVELAALRIVQEALTNSLRHSGRTRVTVTLTFGADALDIDVVDVGGNGHPGRVPDERSPGEEAPVGGYGLVGMRQRVEMNGGLLAAGPDARDGFRVSARLPVAEHAGGSAR
jgi:signal transduction histidine kinase